MSRLGRISHKVLIFYGIKFATQISAVFAELYWPAQPATIGYTLLLDAAHHLSLAKPFSRDSLLGQLQTVFMQKLLFICSLGATLWYFRDLRRVASFYF
jgi:hypothetical protein